MRKKYRFYCYGLMLLMILCTCAKKKEYEEIVLPPISALSFSSEWGVVTINYLRVRQRPSTDSLTFDGLTRGSIVEIISSSGEMETLEEETAEWYSINAEGLRGWVFGAYLKIFGSRAVAMEYARELQ